MSKKFWIGSFLALVALAFFAYQYKYKDRLRVKDLTTSLTYHSEWDIPILPDEQKVIKNILNQSFSYIGKGGQAYAFESQDGQYVLKFLKFKYLRSRLTDQLRSCLPFCEDWQTNEMQRRQRKTFRLYQGYKLAYELNRENSGLLYLHFNPTFNQFGSLILYDKLGFQHSVDLDQVFFILQYKGKLFETVLKELLDQGDIQSAEKKLTAFIHMYLNQYQKGLYDRDYGVLHNIGFVGDRPLHIDMGRLTFDERMKEKNHYTADLHLVVARIEKWLQKNYPQFHSQLMENINSQINF